MVKAAERRKAAQHLMDSYKISQRRATGLTGLSRNGLTYVGCRRDDRPLREELNQLAKQRPRWGFPSLLDALRRGGWRDNHKRVYRIYREESLQLKRRKGRKRLGCRVHKLPLPEQPNQLWAMDFMSDQLAEGRRFRLMTVMDVCTRECLAVEVQRSLSGQRVGEILDGIIQQRGKPQRICTDNGPEFTSLAMDRWVARHQVDHHLIQPGKPVQNAFIESFNSLVRDQCLNAHWFWDLDDARRLINQWVHTYNYERGHGSLGRKTPKEYAREFQNLQPSRPRGRTAAGPSTPSIMNKQPNPEKLTL